MKRFDRQEIEDWPVDPAEMLRRAEDATVTKLEYGILAKYLVVIGHTFTQLSCSCPACEPDPYLTPNQQAAKIDEENLRDYAKYQGEEGR